MHKSFLAVLVVLGTSLAGEDAQNQESQACPRGPKHMRVSARHIEAGGIGYNKGYTTLEFFLASDPRKWEVMPFLDVRGHAFNDGRLAMNAGVGARSIWGCRAYGINAYYDYRRTNRRGYNQVGVGLETLGELWDFRIDGYLPVGGKMSHPYKMKFVGFKGNSIQVKRKFQYAMKGLQGEVGFHFGKTSDFDFYGAIGPYYFKGEIGSGAIGGKGRIAGFYQDYIGVELSDSWDNVFGNNVQGQLTLTFPFGPKSRRPKLTQNRCPDTCEFASALNARMVQPVVRQEIIVVDSHAKKDTTNDFLLFVNNLSHSAGTYESPFPTLAAAIAASTPGDIFYIYPGDGTTNGLNAFDTPFLLQNGQQLLGAGINQTVLTNLGRVTIPAQANTNPSLQANLATSVIQVANNNSIAGLTITADADGDVGGNYCIGSDFGTTMNLKISNNNLIANNGAVGIFPNNPTGQITITNNTVESGDTLGSYGMYFVETSGVGNYNITNNTIANFQNPALITLPFPFVGTAIAIQAQNGTSATANVLGNQVSGCIGNGIYLGAFEGAPFLSGNVQNNQLEGIGEGVGIFAISDDASTMTFQALNNLSQGNAFGLIAQAESTSSMTGLITNNIFEDGPNGSGILVETNYLTRNGSARGNFTIFSNTVSFFDSQGIASASYGTSSLNAVVQNNTVHDIQFSGLYMNSFTYSKNNLTILNNTLYQNNAGMEITPSENSTMSAWVQENTIYNNLGTGILSLPAFHGTGVFDLLSNTLYGNNIQNTYSGSAVTIILDNTSNACLQMLNNSSTMETTTPDYFFNKVGTGSFTVEPFVGNIGTIEEHATTHVPSGYCSQ